MVTFRVKTAFEPGSRPRSSAVIDFVEKCPSVLLVIAPTTDADPIVAETI